MNRILNLIRKVFRLAMILIGLYLVAFWGGWFIATMLVYFTPITQIIFTANLSDFWSLLGLIGGFIVLYVGFELLRKEKFEKIFS